MSNETRWHRIHCPVCGRVMIRVSEPYTGRMLGYCRSRQCKRWRELVLVHGQLAASIDHTELPVTISASMQFVDVSVATVATATAR